MILAEHWLCIGAAIHSIFTQHHEKYMVTGFIRVLLPSLVPQSDSLPMWIALLMCFINENATFIWNYCDVFIMIFGVGLSTHFKLLNIKLEQTAIEVKKTFILHPYDGMRLNLILFCFQRFFFTESISRFLEGNANSVCKIV